MTLEVTFTPAEFGALRKRELSGAACVVFDVLRATSTMVAALAGGAESVLPVETIEQAIRCREADASVLLTGEREGRRITAALTGGVDFDLGNSPRECTSGAVRGRRIVSTTTNGTHAVRACLGAGYVFVGSFLNLSSTAHHLARLDCPHVILVCAGTAEGVAFEDCLGAGALCQRLLSCGGKIVLEDSAVVAADLFSANKDHLNAALRKSANANRLWAIPELREDVKFCMTEDLFPIVVAAGADGLLRQVASEEL
jgi:2-phosphosulfolactate phosphatase